MTGFAHLEIFEISMGCTSTVLTYIQGALVVAVSHSNIEPIPALSPI